MNNRPNTAKITESASHTQSLKRNLLTDLVIYEHVETTASKAKVIIPLFDKVINIAKKDDKRIAESKLNKIFFNENATKKVMDVLVKRLEGDQGGYLNYYKTGRRKGDNAPTIKMIVKGYTYREIGAKAKTKKSKDKTKDQKESKHFEGVETKDMAHQQSQIDTKASQGKAKSRSGI